MDSERGNTYAANLYLSVDSALDVKLKTLHDVNISVIKSLLKLGIFV